MNFTFHKYQGTGNDFIMIDNRSLFFPKENISIVHKICDRKFGIGADGLILLENDPQSDFKMVYYNSDGNESSMCGNGGRCIVAFAKKLAIIKNETTFSAIDGLHYATINEANIVALQMTDVVEVELHNTHVFLNTGSPHHVQEVEDLDQYAIVSEGRKIRNEYGTKGSNVNFVKKMNNTTFKVRTYERGVEDETLACGTGVTAVAIAMHKTGKTDETKIKLPVLGGNLEVSFDVENNIYKNIFLKGPATFVFKGTLSI